MATLVDRPLTPDEAHAVAGWRYPTPFDRYDLRDGAVDVLLHRDDEGQGYYPVVEGDALVGFLCFGAEARVQGQEPMTGTTDIGMGVAPSCVSRGIGGEVLPQAMAFARDAFNARRIRVAVAAFNDRSLRLCTSAGFVERRRFDGPGGAEFVELVLDDSAEA